MRKLTAILFATSLLAVSGAAVAQSTMMQEKKMTTSEMRMKGMDANNDGMVSKEEFMRYHESMWDKMKRNPAGMAMMADVESMYGSGVVSSAIPGEPAKKARP